MKHTGPRLRNAALLALALSWLGQPVYLCALDCLLGGHGPPAAVHHLSDLAHASCDRPAVLTAPHPIGAGMLLLSTPVEPLALVQTSAPAVPPASAARPPPTDVFLQPTPPPPRS